MSRIGSHAMVLAAGLGNRMRPLTATTPKPLIEVNGKALIDYGFARLRQAKVERAVVNVHYLPEQIEAWAARQPTPEIIISDERAELLDTGGGLQKALPHLGDAPFFVLNSDSFWVDGAVPALQRLVDAWDDGRMDCLLLLCPLAKAVGYDGAGDFVIDARGRLTRGQGEAPAAVNIGSYLVHPRLFANAPKGRYSINVLWNQAIAAGRLHGLLHDGLWLHVGTPQSIGLAEKALAAY